MFEVFTPVERDVNKDAYSIMFGVTPAGIFPLDEERAKKKLIDKIKLSTYERVIVAETDYWRWNYDTTLKTIFIQLKEVPPPISDKNMPAILQRLTELTFRFTGQKTIISFHFW